MAELRVLVVEEEISGRRLLVSILENDGYEVCVADGCTAVRASADFRPDLALIDGCLKGSDGVEVARRLRQAGNLPIIFVTAAHSAEDIYAGFRMGVDDYIVKPFDREELSCRVRAVLGRVGHAVAQTWTCGDVVVDDGSRSVTRGGSPVSLTVTEFKLLGVLIRNPKRLLRRTQLLGQVWGYDADEHLLEVHMSALRHKLEAHGSRVIETVRGTGYVLRP